LREIALHILDLAENSTRAGASLVEIDIEERTKEDRLLIRIMDNGRGFDSALKSDDSYFTCKEGKRFGLGIPFIRQAAESCQGSFRVDSSPGKGTTVEAGFMLSHIDLAPMGDLGATLLSLVGGNPETDFVLRHVKDSQRYVFDTRRLREELDGLPLNVPQVLQYIKENVNEGTRRQNGR
jgi:anti-sigma regulatory factor (Ser/Thr protein kinase)